MAILSNLLVRIGVDEDGVRRGVMQAESDFQRFGDFAERLSGRFRGFGQESGRQFGDGFTRDANGRLHDSLGRFVREGGSAGSEMGSIFARAFGSTGPPGMVVAITAAFALLPAAAAAAATGMVLAFGGALVGLGAMVLMHTEKATSDMSKAEKKAVEDANKTAERLQKGMRTTMRAIRLDLVEAFKPLVPVLETVGKVARRTVKAFAPFIQQAMTKAAPHLQKFIEQLGQAFTNLAPVIPPVMDAFTLLLDQIGPVLPGIFEQIAGAITDIANVVAQNPELFARFVTDMIQLVPWALKLVLALTKLFVWVSKVLDTTSPLVTILGLLVPGLIIARVLFDKLSGVLPKVGAAFGTLWNKIRTVWDRIYSTVKTALSKVKQAITSGINGAKNLFSRGWSAIRNAASTGVSRVVGVVRRIPGRIKSALGNLGSLLYRAGKNVIQGLINGIRSMLGKVGGVMGEVTGKIRGFLPFSPAKEGPLSGRGNPMLAGRKIATMVADGLARGTGAVASAASGVAGAAAVTGTAGIAPGAFPTPGGVRAAAAGAGPVLEIRSDGSRVGDLLVEILRMAIRDRGGNVQTALGRR